MNLIEMLKILSSFNTKKVMKSATVTKIYRFDYEFKPHVTEKGLIRLKSN